MERALSVLNGSVKTDILKEDQYLLFLFKKTERIVAALYVVTGSFQDIEPLKWSIRESGTLLIKHTLSIKERTIVHSQEFLSDTHAEITRMLSILDLAHIADLLSPMNFSVLKGELEGLINIVESKWRISNLPTPPAHTLQEDFFGIPRSIFGGTKENKNNMFLSNFQYAEQNNKGETKPLRALADFERFRRSQKDTSKGQIQTTGVLHDGGQIPIPRRRIQESTVDMSLKNTLRRLSKIKEDRILLQYCVSKPAPQLRISPRWQPNAVRKQFRGSSLKWYKEVSLREVVAAGGVAILWFRFSKRNSCLYLLCPILWCRR